ncbi:MAG TPA: hypothetical protein IAA10_01455 [Candidatus Blautia intestinavium]|nr:hypothetical protein [Candidatus Blautia intestinavium]
MKSKMVRKLTALFVAGTMMAAMGTTAMAAENPTNLTITKELIKEVNAYAPNTEFQFSIVPGAAGVTEDGMPITAGPEGGVSFAGGNDSVKFTDGVGQGSMEQTLSLVVNNGSFSAPGIYRYTVSEVKGNYEGVQYDETTKNFDVYVNSDGDVYAYTFTDAGAENGKDDGVFTNKYDENTGLGDLKITKEVTGNQGNKSQEFTFTIGVDGADGEQYHVVYGSENTVVELNSGETKEIQLSDGETATIYGLSASDEYTVTEDDYSSQGYDTTINEQDTNTVTGTLSDAKEIKVVNDKEATTPTGIVTDIAPYVIMVAAAVVLGFAFLRKRSYNK